MLYFFSSLIDGQSQTGSAHSFYPYLFAINIFPVFSDFSLPFQTDILNYARERITKKIS